MRILRTKTCWGLAAALCGAYASTGVASPDADDRAALFAPSLSLNLFPEEPAGAETSDTAAPAEAGGDAALATRLSSPVASLISVPFQLNFDQDIGPDDEGERLQLNFQPVIPFSLSEDWNLISRTITPIIYQDDVVPGAGDQFGLGDITQSLFFSPKEPTAGGVIWGAGPVFLLPTATDDLLGSEKFGIGPTFVALKQEKGWTYGALLNHVWSVAGDDDRADVNSTFIQPFLSYTTPDAWTFALNTETTFNWETDDWSVPVTLTASKLLRFGDQPVQIGGGVRYWAKSPSGGPEGIAFRLQMTLLFPQ